MFFLYQYSAQNINVFFALAIQNHAIFVIIFTEVGIITDGLYIAV